MAADGEQQLVRQLGQDAVAGGFGEDPVELGVEFRQALERVGAQAATHLLLDRFQLRQLGVRDALGGEPGDQALDRLAGQEDAAHLGGVHHGDGHPGVHPGHHQAIRLQPLDGLADGDLAHAEAPGELIHVDALARLEVPLDDGSPQAVVDEVGLAPHHGQPRPVRLCHLLIVFDMPPIPRGGRVGRRGPGTRTGAAGQRGRVRGRCGPPTGRYGRWTRTGRPSKAAAAPVVPAAAPTGASATRLRAGSSPAGEAVPSTTRNGNAAWRSFRIFPPLAKADDYEGRSYGAPLHFDVDVMMYRTDILQQYGFSAPPKTLTRPVALPSRPVASRRVAFRPVAARPVASRRVEPQARTARSQYGHTRVLHSGGYHGASAPGARYGSLRIRPVPAPHRVASPGSPGDSGAGRAACTARTPST